MPERARRQYFLIVVIAALGAFLSAFTAINRLHGFDTYIIDLGYFHTQMLQAAGGALPKTAVIPPYEEAYLGNHFSPLLAVLAPLYWLWPHAETLLAAQAVLVYSALPLLFVIATELGMKPRAALLFVLLTAALNPYFFCTPYNDFHENALAVPLMCLGLLGTVRRRFTLMLAGALPLMLVKEHYGIALAGFGLLWGIRHGEWRRASAVMALGAAYTAVVLGVVQPALHGGAVPMMDASRQELLLRRYTWITPSVESLVFFWNLMTYKGISGSLYLALLLGFSGCLPPLAWPLLLPGTADLLANLLSTAEMQRYPGLYYSAPLVPVLSVAAMQAWQASPRLTPQVRKGSVIIAALCCCAALSSVPGKITPRMFRYVAYREDQRQALDRIDAALEGCAYPLVQSNIAANLTLPGSARPFLAELLPGADCAVLWLDYPARPIRLTPSPYYPLSPAGYLAAAQRILAEEGWKVLYAQGPWLMLTRQAARPEAEDPGAARAAAAQRLAELKKRMAAAGVLPAAPP